MSRDKRTANASASDAKVKKCVVCCGVVFFFFNDTATTEIYTLSLHDALPISQRISSPLPS